MARKGILSKLDPEIIKNAGTLAANGMTDRGIYDYLGITADTFYKWMNKGEERKGSLYAEFAETIKKGRSALQADCLKDINMARRSGEWQAAAWVLERRWPDEYGKRDKLDMSVTSVKIVDDLGEDEPD